MLALALCLGVVFGGSIPEVGNFARYYIYKTSVDPHYFNGYFIVLGVLGIIICGLTLYRRLLRSVADILVEKRNKRGE